MIVDGYVSKYITSEIYKYCNDKNECFFPIFVYKDIDFFKRYNIEYTNASMALGNESFFSKKEWSLAKDKVFNQFYSSNIVNPSVITILNIIERELFNEK